MDSSGGQQPERLEDQLRRMILTNGSAQAQAGPNQAGQQAHPTVRLPPSNAYQASQQFQGAPSARNQPPPPQRWHSRGYGSPFHGHHPQLHQEQIHSGSSPQHGRHRSAQFTGTPPYGRFGHRQQAYNSVPQPSSNFAPHQRARNHQQTQLDPDAFQRRGFSGPHPDQNPTQQLFNPNVPPRGPMQNTISDRHFRQTQYLEQIAASEISNVEMTPAERNEKDSFRSALQTICHDVSQTASERLPQVSLECFGSFKSGFATAGSDMDLVIVVKNDTKNAAHFSLLEDDLPRVLEKKLLQLGYGARLLTRTRVPIIKVCEKPDSVLLDKLREEREKWDELPHEKKYPHLHQNEDGTEGGEAEPAAQVTTAEHIAAGSATEASITTKKAEVEAAQLVTDVHANVIVDTNGTNLHADVQKADSATEVQVDVKTSQQQKQRPEDSQPWTRERKAGPLDFPKIGVGIQSDINFFNPLGIHNTQLMRCYSLCDARVRPMVLFVKAWVKRRKINSSYSGTLSSYGYVLMVLHYLINIAYPPVLPNLQAAWRPQGYQQPDPSGGESVDDWNVQFWREEEEIIAAAQHGLLTANREPLGSLLAGFFNYYASQGGTASFTWMQEVLSLRSIGGIMSKEEKGWTKAFTEEGQGKKVQHRYLFCIEDPFELNHNVARTVTHKGIVAIRDEFRRARRILQSVGNGLFAKDGELFSQLVEVEDFKKAVEDVKANGPQNGSVVEMVGNGGEDATPSQNRRVNGQPHFNNRHRGTASLSQPRGPARGDNRMASGPAPRTSSFDVHDSESFPSLGTTKAAKKKNIAQYQDVRSEDWSEISGDKAKRYLEEVKRKRDDAQMESTASGVAEAVLGDSD